MPCMCGDLYCWSCGPAQGNSKCEVCGKWAMDGGCDEPEKCIVIAQENDKAMAEEWERMERDAAEYWANHKGEQ